LLENPRAELRRHLARLHVVREQIRAIEQSRLGKLAMTSEMARTNEGQQLKANSYLLEQNSIHKH